MFHRSSASEHVVELFPINKNRGKHKRTHKKFYANDGRELLAFNIRAISIQA
jgi:hypothetical protein